MRFRSMLFVGLITACGGSESAIEPPTSYADVSGQYSGTITASSLGLALNATFSITVAQKGGALSGSDAIVGTFNETPTSATGSFTGSIAAGNNPSVYVVSTTAGCPALHAEYSGSFDAANRRLTMTGPVYVTNPGCSIAATYELTLTLTK
jgi:hypothetical protein